MRKVRIIRPDQMPFVKPYGIVNNFFGFQVADFVGIITMVDTPMEGVAKIDSEAPRLWPIDDDRLELVSLIVEPCGGVRLLPEPPLLKFDGASFSGVLS